MPISDTASSPPGSAGEGGGLQASFERAIADVGMPEDNFHPAAGDPEPEVEVDETYADENADAKPAAKPVAASVKAKINGKEPAKPAAQPESAVLTAPANWDASRKAAFDKLPTPEAKKLLLDMSKGLEAEYGRKTTEHANKVKYAEAIDGLVTAEHRQQMAAGGFRSVVDGLAHLIRINDRATRDFPGYARWAMEQYAGDAPIADVLQSIFPEAFTGSTQAQPGAQPAPRPAIDPQTKQVYDVLQQVMQEVNGLKQGNQQAQLRTADQVIAKFRSEADDAGNPKRPHLAQVEQQMVALLGTPKFVGIEDMGERLQLAYDTAVALDPTLRQTVLDSEVQRRLAEQNKAADLAKARRARAPINSPPSGPASKPIKGIDGALRQAGALTGLI